MTAKVGHRGPRGARADAAEQDLFATRSGELLRAERLNGAALETRANEARARLAEAEAKLDAATQRQAALQEQAERLADQAQGAAAGGALLRLTPPAAARRAGRAERQGGHEEHGHPCPGARAAGAYRRGQPCRAPAPGRALGQGQATGHGELSVGPPRGVHADARGAPRPHLRRPHRAAASPLQANKSVITYLNQEMNSKWVSPVFHPAV
jgi:hypothetical protein